MNLDLFSCMVNFSKADPVNLSHLRWSSLQQLVTIETCKGACNQQTVLACWCVTQPSLQVKLKADGNDHALKVFPDTLLCFADMFLHFFKNANYFLFHQHTVSNWKLITKKKTGIILISSSGVLLTETIIKMWSEKMSLIKCRKNSCEGALF